MKFWDFPRPEQAGSPALVDEAGQVVSYGELSSRVDLVANGLRELGSRQLGFLFMSNTAACLAAYLGCLRSGHVPLLLPADRDDEWAAPLRQQYQPAWSWRPGQSGGAAPLQGLQTHALEAGAPALAPELGLLLSTSGSTGSAKLVRLSYDNLQANAASIAQYLQLTPQERPLTVLPPHYSYGLSIINSHLFAGACLVVRDVSVLTRDFADTIRRYEVTSISGVPYTYQMLARTGFSKLELPSLRTMTQAGGKLDERLVTEFGRLAQDRGWRFFVMYGQTEATARISFVPPQELLANPGTVGIAIPGGRLRLDPDTSELIYEGPNVMLGYAQSRADLALGDQLHGVLRTGDLAQQDAQGFFRIVGRISRFIKVAGNRIGLDDVEAQLSTELGQAAMAHGRDERLVVWLESSEHDIEERARQVLATRCGVHHSMFRLRLLDQLPRMSNGKKDYNAMTADF